jgi:hypothetical protein
VFQWQPVLALLPSAAGGRHSAQNSPEKMRTAVVWLLHDPKPSSSLAGFSRTAVLASGPEQSSTCEVQPSASGPEMVHAPASDASVGVLALADQAMETPGGEMGMLTQPAVSNMPVVVLKNWHTSAPADGSEVVDAG